MPGTSPVYKLPYALPGDAARTFPATSEKLTQVLERTLQNQGRPPVGSDVILINARLAALENGKPKDGPIGLTIRSANTVTLPQGAYRNIAEDSVWNPANPGSMLDGMTYKNGFVIAEEGLYEVGYNFALPPTTPMIFGIGINMTAPTYQAFVAGQTATTGTGAIVISAANPVILKPGDVVSLWVYCHSASVPLPSGQGQIFFCRKIRELPKK